MAVRCFCEEKYEAVLLLLPALVVVSVGGGEVESSDEAKSSRVVDGEQSMTAHSRPKVLVAI